MNKELIITSSDDEVQIALLEDKVLVELHKEQKNNTFSVGDIFVGKVKKIMSGLNAAFIDVDNEKDGFVHYLDLGPEYYSVNKFLKLAMNGDPSAVTLKGFKKEPILPKSGKLNEVVNIGQLILLQVAKEPISTKGPKMTGDISLAGRYLVLTPFCDRVSISQKIKGAEERSRLRRLIQSIKPEGFGVIVRTLAEGVSVSDLDTDLKNLIDRWGQMCDHIKHLTCPKKVLSELRSTSAMLRDLLNDEFDAIYTDNEDLYHELCQYIQTIAPDKVDVVRHYKMETPIFEQFGIQRDIRRAFGKIVTIRSGIYLYVEHTEAMHVIDVNSGNHIKSGDGQEDTALQVNIEAAKEIARQLRLRDMGGIIIVDFVDMNKAENRHKLFEEMTTAMSHDKARHTILPLSKFGLMQITRQRVRPVIEVDVQEKCPFCDGSGAIKASITVVDEIEQNIKYLTTTQRPKKLTILVHPFVHAYLTNGLKSIQRQWMWRYKLRLKFKVIEKFNLLEYKFLDSNNDEIDM